MPRDLASSSIGSGAERRKQEGYSRRGGSKSSNACRTKADLAPRSSEKEDRYVKPFIGTLRVTNPVRQSRASSRKRVLRGDGRPSLRSVDSEIKRCAIEPRNFLVVSLRLGQKRGPCQVSATLGPTQRAWSHRGRRTWRMNTRVPRELGRPCRLHRTCRQENRDKNSRMIPS